jgi:hypothetical protein
MKLRALLLAIAIASLAIAVACTTFASATDDTAVDAATEGGSEAAPADAGRICDDPAWTLCDDFDDNGKNVWSDKQVDVGGALDITTTRSYTAPASLSVSAVANPTACAYVVRRRYFDTNFPDTTNGLHFETQLFIDDLPSEVAFGPSVTLQDADGGTQCSFYFRGDNSAVSIVEQGPTTPATLLTRNVTPGGWNKLGVDIDGPPGMRTLKVKVNDVEAANKPVVPACQYVTGINRISVGIFCLDSSQAGTYKLGWDDLAVRTK